MLSVSYVRAAAVAALAMVAISSPVWAQSGRCYSDAELKTIQLYSLKTEYMIGALNCRGATESTFRDKFGLWANKFSPDLAAHGELVKKHFNARYGGAGPSQLNQFMTRLANIVSLAAHGNPKFCVDVLNNLDASMAPTVRGFDDGPKPRDYSAEMGLAACPPKPAPAAPPAAAKK